MIVCSSQGFNVSGTECSYIGKVPAAPSKRVSAKTFD